MKCKVVLGLLRDIRRCCDPWFNESGGYGELQWTSQEVVDGGEEWRGFLWQGCLKSYPMNEHSVLAAARYIEQNPVRAKLVKEAWEYPWSSARAHVEGEEDSLVTVGAILEMVGDWKKFLVGGKQPQTRRKLTMDIHLALCLACSSFPISDASLAPLGRDHK